MNHRPTSESFGIRSPGRLSHTETGPDLAFMLARQATNRMRLDLRRLADAPTTSRDPGFAQYEAEIAIGQIDALAERIRPFAAFSDQAIRFEAQEILAALDSIRHDMIAIADQLEPARGKTASEVAARLMSRRI